MQGIKVIVVAIVVWMMMMMNTTNTDWGCTSTEKLGLFLDLN